MFKILVIQATNNLSNERAEFLINDRLSFMRFLGLGLEARVPDARTIWLFREKLTTAGAIKRLFEQFDAMLRQAGYIAMSGQIVDASLVAAQRQRNTADEKKAIKQGRIPANWKAKPALEGQAGQATAQGSRRALDCQIQQGQTARDGSMPPVDLAIPLFGYQNHVSIDHRFGFIRRWAATDAAANEGRRLRQGLLDKSNTASGVWADTAYRSAANETFLTKKGFVSHIHRKKPKGRAMHETMRRANNAKSKIRACVEHVFAEQKDRMGLFIRTIGIARATTKIGMAKLVYNIKRHVSRARSLCNSSIRTAHPFLAPVVEFVTSSRPKGAARPIIKFRAFACRPPDRRSSAIATQPNASGPELHRTSSGVTLIAGANHHFSDSLLSIPLKGIGRAT